ncbi:unnamed protein product [Spirodela intermedia]|uniref:Uncharacterized protein n=1 Tax=Spirodela intermedia TaxID=51605 RepID=A0A7I8JKU2_SPIIN|nr:unnamed protein product [Spirodela intermedia]CAA6670807.1 unnamed protein product [Spirodela intermedia]
MSAMPYAKVHILKLNLQNSDRGSSHPPKRPRKINKRSLTDPDPDPYVYERDIQRREERKGLNRGTPEHLLISDVSISMERVTHYFDEYFLRTEEDSVNTRNLAYSKSHLSKSIVKESPAI